jgi:hypothetical protein
LFITYYKDTMSYYERMKKGHLMMIENNRMMKSLLINMVDNYDNFLNSLNEITEETETRDIGVNTDYIDDNDDDIYRYIKHIMGDDGITINGELHKWRKYTEDCEFLRSTLYKDYCVFTEGFNQKPREYDDFIKIIKERYGRDIILTETIWDEMSMTFEKISIYKDLIDKL